MHDLLLFVEKEVQLDGAIDVHVVNISYSKLVL